MFRILVVGLLTRIKNVGAGIEAIRQLKDVKLTIVGDGPERKRLEALVEPRVEFKGFVTDSELDKLYFTCDLVLYPVLFEPFGLVPIEAMHHGKPVICSEKAGVAEIVQEAKCGFLVDPRKPQEIAKKIEILRRDKKLRWEMGKNGKRYAQQRLTGRHFVAKFEEMLTSLATSPHLK